MNLPELAPEPILIELTSEPDPRDRQGFRLPPADVRLAKILKYARANGFRARWGRKGESVERAEGDKAKAQPSA